MCVCVHTAMYTQTHTWVYIIYSTKQEVLNQKLLILKRGDETNEKGNSLWDEWGELKWKMLNEE